MNAQEMFRPFEFTEWILGGNPQEPSVYKIQQQINLADVKNYSTFTFPNHEDFPKGEMCRISTYGGESYCAQIPYAEFRAIHHKFLIDYGIFDPRSLGSKKK